MKIRLRSRPSHCAAALPTACALGLTIGAPPLVQAQSAVPAPAASATAPQRQPEPNAPAQATPNAAAAGRSSTPTAARRAFEVQLFGVQGLRSDARIPNASSATRFALESLVGGGTGRSEAIWPLGAHGELRGQAAPTASDGRTPAAAFAGQPLAVEADTMSRSRLDAWRLTWRYSLLDSPAMSVKVGLTARMHEARIVPRPGSTLTDRQDAGIVPLLHASVESALSGGLTMVADIDAAGGARGGMIDAGVRLRYAIDRDWSASVSYRILNDGAGLPGAYDASRFHYLGVGVRRAF